MDYSSRQLRAFHLVAQHLSFARAAEALRITPSGLSVLIRELERQLCFRLFDRTTRQVSLTADGRELLAITKSALSSVDTAILRIEKSSQGKRRPISLGAMPWVAANVIPPAIREFREVRPEVQIGIFDGSLEAIARRVQAGKLDLAVGLFDKLPELRRVRFFRFSLMVIRPDRDGKVKRTTTQWSSLNGQTLISLTSKYPHQRLIERELRRAKVRCNTGQTVNLLDTQIGLVEAQEGIAIIPSFGLPACSNRRVAMSELVEPVVSLEFHEISSRGRKMPEDAAEFSAFLKRFIARWAGEAGAL